MVWPVAAEWRCGSRRRNHSDRRALTRKADQGGNQFVGQNTAARIRREALVRSGELESIVIAKAIRHQRQVAGMARRARERPARDRGDQHSLASH